MTHEDSLGPRGHRIDEKATVGCRLLRAAEVCVAVVIEHRTGVFLTFLRFIDRVDLGLLPYLRNALLLRRLLHSQPPRVGNQLDVGPAQRRAGSLVGDHSPKPAGASQKEVLLEAFTLGDIELGSERNITRRPELDLVPSRLELFALEAPIGIADLT